MEKTDVPFGLNLQCDVFATSDWMRKSTPELHCLSTTNTCFQQHEDAPLTSIAIFLAHKSNSMLPKKKKKGPESGAELI